MAEFVLGASTYITASGENTTFQLTPPGEKTTGDFQAGRIQDDENPTDAVDLGEDKYTEIEFCIQPTDEAEVGETYEFRLTKSDLWLPTDIGGCKRWGRSDLGITKDGSDRIDTYADQSGTAGSDYTQVTDAKKPLFVANQIDGQASIRFDAIDDYMSCTGAGLVAAFSGDDLPVTVFWVSRKTASGGDVYPWCAANTGGVAPFFGAWDYGSFAVRRRGNASDLVGVYDGAFDANWNYWVMNFHGTTVSLRKNGVTVIDNEAMHTTTVDGINIVILGARDEGVTGICDVEFAEDGVYDNDISGASITLLQTYLATRYPSI